MTAPIDTSLTAEIWNQSIDDMLASFPQSNRLGGPGPFVINLTASTAPIELPAKSIAGGHALVYQVQRTEDRRQRYRLRLGPFATEDEADSILIQARDTYPGALTATAEADDLRAIAAMRAKTEAAAAPTPTPAAAATAEPAAVPSPRPAAAATPEPAAVPTLMTATAPAPKPAAATTPRPVAAATRKPAPVPMPRPAAATSKAAAAPTPRPAAAATPSVPAPAAEPAAAGLRLPQKGATVSTARQVEQFNGHLPSLETTQTVRALTTLELEDDQASRWFVIQLSLAEDAFDPDTVPNLDIFSVYRLYSVAGIDQGRIVHALRLGFFGEEAAANAVASYLAAFYDKPTIKRVSVAERQRFADQPLEPRKDVGATGKLAVIEITSERFVRERRNSGT